jgi:hypothetical protein
VVRRASWRICTRHSRSTAHLAYPGRVQWAATGSRALKADAEGEATVGRALEAHAKERTARKHQGKRWGEHTQLTRDERREKGKQAPHGADPVQL